MSHGAHDAAFRTLFEPHRRAITLHCYRMLGSLQDAEELAQETLLRAWQRRDEVRDTSAFRTWLYQIATNACLDQLRKARRRRRTLPHLVAAPSSSTRLGPPLEEQLWLEPVPDSLLELADDARQRPDARAARRESIGLAFIAALQLLSPKQRAALLLVDVLGWNPQETATLLETSVASVNSLLQRARKSVESRGEAESAKAVSSADSELLARFISAWEQGDLEAFSALLAEDALFAMPPQPEWFAGRAAIVELFGAMWAARPGPRRLTPLAANGGLAVALYSQPNPPDGAFQAAGITLVTFHQGRVSLLVRFGLPRLFPSFGVPLQLAAP
ncbi:MAG: RNA polymerase subunit sigma-70 [Myxococcales bacterium]